mgnify:CR=1 FL=1|jgi:hypothetical protein
MNSYPIAQENKVKRIAEKAAYDKETIHQIIDEALFCHIGIIHDGKPVVIPTIHARTGDHLIFHGSKASRLIKSSDQNDICITITLLDGLVIGRSHFHHSMNYRSVVLFGKADIISDEQERIAAFHALSNHIAPGRWNDARKPNESELKQTAVLKMKIDSASAKISNKFPTDEEEDYELSYWAGIIPINQSFGEPKDDPQLKKGIEVPEYLKNYCRD